MQSRQNCQRHILLLAGTGEGPKLATAMIDNGWNVTVSVVSHTASWAYSDVPLTSILVGALSGVDGIKKTLKKAESLHKGYECVVDATHPFAEEISANLQKACSDFKQRLLRLERPLEHVVGTHLIENVNQISKYSLKGKNILMAIGSRYLRESVAAVNQSGAKVFARVLPTPESFKKALISSIHEDALAIIRPWESKNAGEFERALCRRWSISDVVCRQSGGPTQRLWQEICCQEKIDLWLVARPKLVDGVDVVYSVQEVLNAISSYN